MKNTARVLIGTLGVAALACAGFGAEAGGPAPAPAPATAPASVPAPAGGVPEWLGRPLSLAECLDIAMTRNAAVLRSRRELEAAYGVVEQTRAIAIPKVRASGEYGIVGEGSVEKLTFPIPGGGTMGIDPSDQHWSGNVRLVQSIYEGGRIRAALRSAKLTKEQALHQHQAVLADTAMEVRTTYYDVLLAAQQIVVNEASVALLQKELEDTNRRFAAGTVPRFNVLRAEVELANARPRLIKARNAHKTGKDNLANLLGYDLPRDIQEDIPLQLSGTLDAEPLDMSLSSALAQALERRPELEALRRGEELRREAVKSARGGYLPSVQAYGGYGSRNSSFSSDLSRDVSGWQAGVQVSWDIFDGFLTRGKVRQAEAQRDRAEVDTRDFSRRVELEVRTSYSNLGEAWEVMESQKKVQEQAQEAVRLAQARSEAGTGTLLDVLSAQTALTEARTTQILARRDYAVARARFERAIGSFAPRAEGTPAPAAARAVPAEKKP